MFPANQDSPVSHIVALNAGHFAALAVFHAAKKLNNRHARMFV